MSQRNIEIDPLNFMDIFMFDGSWLHCKGSLGINILQW